MTDERRRDEPTDDALVEAAWRKVSRDEPPASLDAAILAAARAGTRRPAPGQGVAARRAWWTRWQPLAAAAGVAGLAFVLVQTIPREEPSRSPATVERKSRVDEPVGPPARSEDVPAESTAAQASDAAPATIPAVRTPPPAAAPAAAEAVAEPPPMPAQQAVGTRESVAGPAAAEDASAGRSATAGAAARADLQAEAGSPDAWARRIAALHGAGDLAAAAAELREFRLAIPDADQFLPDDLRDWAAGTPRPDAP